MRYGRINGIGQSVAREMFGADDDDLDMPDEDDLDLPDLPDADVDIDGDLPDIPGVDPGGYSLDAEFDPDLALIEKIRIGPNALAAPAAALGLAGGAMLGAGLSGLVHRAEHKDERRARRDKRQEDRRAERNLRREGRAPSPGLGEDAFGAIGDRVCQDLFGGCD